MKEIEKVSLPVYSVEAQKQVKEVVKAQKLQNQVVEELAEENKTVVVKGATDFLMEQQRKEDMKRITKCKADIICSKGKLYDTIYNEFRSLYKTYPDRFEDVLEAPYDQLLRETHKDMLKTYKSINKSDYNLWKQRDVRIQNELWFCKIFHCKCTK